ncbi:TetR/AcrR family transcriptional regulator [Corynebacterium sp.]|jgi:AcrR family transcriptional regulator|uniref:TetR/AcrR family transcriptional regulator n=1 Tax=Corynebacterium sp. TaxID=1720 RepID=UPI0025B86892|nr:TetR/AcrR family transcriptional regulator [Corynebacterium sp.]
MVSYPRPGIKSRLLDAVTVLLDERDPSELTITMVVARAGVTRPTFYAAFGDLPTAYAEAAVARIMAALPANPVKANGVERRDVMKATITQALERIAPHAQFFRRVLLGHGGHHVQARIIEYLAAEFRSRTPVSAALARGPLPLETSSTAIAAAVSWTMLDWFTDPQRESVEDLAGRLRDLTYHAVVGGLGRDETPKGISP